MFSASGRSPYLGEATIPTCPDNRELGDHGQHVEQQPAYRIGGVVQRAADVELYAATGEVFDDVAGVGQRAGQPVELGDHEGVPVPARGEGFAQSGASAGGAGEPVIDVDPFRGDSQRAERVTLCGEVLFVGGDPCIRSALSACLN